MGFLDENGPFTWKPGTYQPLQNSWSWTNLTNVVWIDQPVRIIRCLSRLSASELKTVCVLLSYVELD